MADFASLLIGLQNREQLPPVVADELDQLTAGIQVSFNGLRDNLNAQTNAHCVAYYSTTQSLTSGVNTLLSLDKFDSDPNGMLSVATSSIRIQIAGFYLLLGFSTFGASAAGTNRMLTFLKNGNGLKQQTYSPMGGGFTTNATIFELLPLLAGDTLQLYGYQDSGGALTAGNASIRFAQTQLAAAKLF